MARYPMKREAGQSVDEMAAQLEANSAGNRLNRIYPEVAAGVKRQALADVVNQQRELMKTAKKRGRRINLDDLDEVELTVDNYMQACVKANCFPSMLGFAAAAGWSRKSIYAYISKAGTRSAEYLDNVRSSWAAIMAQMALSRQASEATAIFLLKNSGQDLTDKCEITAIPASVDRFGNMSNEEIENWIKEAYEPLESNFEPNDEGGDTL